MLVTIEDGSVGGFGSAVMQHLAWAGLLDGGLKIRPMVLPDRFVDHRHPRRTAGRCRTDREGYRADGVGCVSEGVAGGVVTDLRSPRPSPEGERRRPALQGKGERARSARERAGWVKRIPSHARDESTENAGRPVPWWIVASSRLQGPAPKPSFSPARSTPGDRRVEKAGQLLPASAPLEVKGQDHPWVSRGGLKLDHALAHFGSLGRGTRTCLDVGASTGGFTDVLLSHGAARVHAVDVGPRATGVETSQ